MTTPLRATLYMKPGCHLCEDTLRDLERLRRHRPLTLALVDITTDAELMRRYGERIPVLQLDGHEYDPPLVGTALERVLEQAAAAHAEAEGGRQ